MRSFSHILMTAGLAKNKKLAKAKYISFVAGSLLPDLPLIALSSSLFLRNTNTAKAHEIMHYNFENNSLWIILHNTPHSLVVLLALLALGYFLKRKKSGDWLFWLILGALIHTVIDIFTHYSDGPRFLFPLSWTIRFLSPVSYWDPNHYGRIFSIFEYLFDFSLLLYLLKDYFKKNFKKIKELYRSFTKALFQ